MAEEPKVYLSFSFGTNQYKQPVKQAIVSNENDAIAIDVDEKTLVGRSSTGRGPAERIEPVSPLYIENKQLKITLPDPQLIPMASQAEAEAGADNLKHMTPLRTAQAIEALTPEPPEPPEALVGLTYVTTLGQSSITIPTNASRAFVRMQGAGGGGSRYNGLNSCGGAGGYLEKLLTGLTPGLTLTATLGTPGATNGGYAYDNSTDGGVTTLASGTQSISTLTCNGGGRGHGLGVLGTGGTATGGDFNRTGSVGIDNGEGFPFAPSGLFNGKTGGFECDGYGYGGSALDQGNYTAKPGGPPIIIIQWYS